MRKAAICSTLTILLSVPCLFGQTAHETSEQFQARTKWWREAKFGMFIHWGIYAVPADSTDLAGHKRIAEWYFSNKQMQVKDYEKFAAQFNPTQFDAREWVRTADDVLWRRTKLGLVMTAAEAQRVAAFLARVKPPAAFPAAAASAPAGQTAYR